MSKKRIQITIDRLVNPHNYAHKGMDFTGYGRRISKRLEKSLYKVSWRRGQRIQRTKDLEYTFLCLIEKHRPGIDFLNKSKTQEKFFEYLKEHNIDYEYGFNSLGDTVFCIDWNKYPKLEKIANRLFDDVGFIYETYETCSSCGAMVPSELGYYGDTLQYHITDCDLLCIDCQKDDIESMIDDVKNDYERCLKSYLIEDIEKEGFKKVFVWDFESGLHSHQTDTPQGVIKSLDKNVLDKYDYIFCLTGSGQFDVSYNLWIRKIEY